MKLNGNLIIALSFWMLLGVLFFCPTDLSAQTTVAKPFLNETQTSRPEEGKNIQHSELIKIWEKMQQMEAYIMDLEVEIKDLKNQTPGRKTEIGFRNKENRAEEALVIEFGEKTGQGEKAGMREEAIH